MKEECTKMNNEFNFQLTRLIGSKCRGISVVGDSLLSSYFEFEMPSKIASVPLENVISLVILCSWRLDSNRFIISGYTDTPFDENKELKIFGPLIGLSIKGFFLSLPGYDLSLEFENGYLLKIFCNETNIYNKNKNYIFFTPSDAYVVGNKSELYKDSRSLLDKFLITSKP